ncbi:hypothetical protein GCM10010304_19800 [Streptomyces roseoviolaceus]
MAEPAAIKDPAKTAAAFRDFIVFLSSATHVAGVVSVAVPNEPWPGQKPELPKIANTSYEIY